jgi:UDP-3-O-[3-hydroxymyristoyl] glucosamine N-acyltransferase
MIDVNASDIANFLNTELIGEDMYVNSVSSISSPKDNSLVFAKNTFQLEGDTGALVLCNSEAYDQCYKNTSSNYIICSNPRLAFAKVVKHFFVQYKSPHIHETAIISGDANVHPSVSIGAHCVVEPGVSIGEGTVLNNNVIVSENVKIGKFCYIKSGAVIGEEGFGFDFEDDKSPVRLPHLGSVRIGNNVEIGSNTVIARGTLNETLIADNVKLDDLVFIAHNVVIKSGSMIIACAQVSGSVEIGENSWVGPNSSIIQKVKIGSGSTIGIGTIATSDLKPNQKIMGISGLPLRALVRFMKMLRA